MIRKPFPEPEDDALAGERGPYDPAPVEERDLWFLPDEGEGDGAEAAPLAPPLPRAERRPLLDPREWRAAQAELGGALAELALRFGALDERLRIAAPDAAQGWRQRLALAEVADLGWWSGVRIPAERLALWTGMRLGATGEDAQALARAGWAVRRLAGGPGPEAGGWAAGAGAFLGRGEAAATADLAEAMGAATALHPLARSCLVFHLWRMLAEGPARDIEAAVLAARHGASAGRGGALFLPLALGGFGGLRAGGPAQARLAAWLRGAERAVLAALLQLDRLAAWERRAEAALAGAQGRTPRALLAVFAAWPAVTAPLAEARSGASRAAVQRNLDLMQGTGLIREITGQGRYRVWTARLGG